MGKKTHQKYHCIAINHLLLSLVVLLAMPEARVLLLSTTPLVLASTLMRPPYADLIH